MTINQLLAYEVEQLESMSDEELKIALEEALRIEPQPSADYHEPTEADETDDEDQENRPKVPKKKKQKKSLKETLTEEMKEMGIDLDDL